MTPAPRRLVRPDPAAVAVVVRGVVEAAVRDAGAAGLVLAAPAGAERALLERWLPGAHVPSVERAAPLVDAAGAGGEGEAWRAAARLAAAEDGLLTAGIENKTLLLVGRARPGLDLLPLGDLWATQVRAMAGEAALPALLEGRGEGEVEAIEATLAAWLEEGHRLTLHALSPDLAGALERSLRGAHPYGRPAVVPKLGRWTAGIDLAL